MFTVRQTEKFVAWLDDLKDKKAQIRIAFGKWREAVLVTGSQLKAKFPKCVFTMGPVIGCTSFVVAG